MTAPTTAPAAERPPALAAVHVLTAAVALAAAAVTARLVPLGPHDGAFHLHWLFLVPLFALAERCPIHLEHRRETISLSLTTLPFVVGLFLVTPSGLVGARLLGCGMALLLRRQPTFKLLLNLSMFWLDAAAGITAFRLLAPVTGVGPAAWPAAFAAAMTCDLVATVVLTSAINLYQRRWEPGVVRTLLIGSIGTAVDACAALLVITLLHEEPAGLVLLAVVLAMLFLSYRVYRSLRENHRNLEQLYVFTTDMGDAVLHDRVATTLAERTKEVMHAEEAWIELGVDPDTVVLEPHLLADCDGMAAVLEGPDGPIGRLVVRNRSGEVRLFEPEDLRLFTTVANHAAIALGNRHLLDRTREQADDARHQSLHDSLTGLPNRLHFHDALAARLADGARAAVLLLDLDRFKDVNDTLGHDKGDALLREVGERLRSVLRAGDLVARLGGDEFAILLPDVDRPEAAVTVARSVVEVLGLPFRLDDVSVAVGASVGVALAPEHGTEGPLLLQRADVAMYTAKGDQTGVELYDLSRDDHTRQRLALVGELRDAIAAGDLDVHFQPQVDLVDGRVVGAEALVRWTHATRGMIPPDEFIPVAEQAGLIGPLTRLVLDRALAACASWRTHAPDVRVSVNLSARSLLNESLPDEVLAAIVGAGLPPGALCLELTETSAMLDPRRTLPVLNRLHALGITIALDDFGTGHSSLAYLRRLPVGEIKIDKSFVLGMSEDRFDEAIVCSIIDLARHLLVPVVAEGIEDAAVAERLRREGCAIGQGYGFARPMPAASFEAWLRTAVAA